MSDLVFLEKLARWLTNTQVKIKAEVAANNLQAKRLGQAVARFSAHVATAERPTADAEASFLLFL